MTKVRFPSRCAVAVVCGEHLVSQVYPASVPIEVFMDDIVELLSDDLRRRGAAVPVLVLTARDALADRVRGLDLGADDYMTKPYQEAELVAKVSEMLNIDLQQKRAD